MYIRTVWPADGVCLSIPMVSLRLCLYIYRSAFLWKCALSRSTTHVNNRSVIGDADIIERIEMLDVIGRENSLKLVILQYSN